MQGLKAWGGMEADPTCTRSLWDELVPAEKGTRGRMGDRRMVPCPFIFRWLGIAYLKLVG